MNISERDAQVVWHPFTQAQLEPTCPAIIRGEGALLFDEAGRSYIDAVSSWWVNLHGHAHPYISERLSEQLHILHHSIFAGFTHPPAVELAEKLLKILPGDFSRIFYSDDGSTAVEVALKMALQYWWNKGERRKRVLALEGAYHGDTFGAMSVSAPSSFNAPYKDLLFNVEHVGDPSDYGTIERVRQAIAKEDVAAFIYEPLVQGAAGMRITSADALNPILELCRGQGIFLIADEVMTGFGRTGALFASEYLSVKPDLICLSKGLTGGTLPLGVTAATNEIFDAFLAPSRERMFLHGHSYTANPLACTAALASLELLAAHSCEAAVKAICAMQSEKARQLSADPRARNVRHLGTILAFEVGQDPGSGYHSVLRDRIYKLSLEQGVLLRPLGNTVYVMPPYCITSDQLSCVYNVLDRLLEVLE